MSEGATQTLSISLGGDRSLGVEFVRQGDRYHHTIFVSDGTSRSDYATSLEGDPQQLWPTSPALQQLSLQPLPDGRRVALLVGMAGKSHFSLSVIADEPSQRLVFEAACRYQTKPQFLGSTYEKRCQTPFVAGFEFEFDDSFPTKTSSGDGASVMFLPAEGNWPPPALARWWYAIKLRS